MKKTRKKKIHVGLHGKVEKLRQTLADVGGAVGELAGKAVLEKQSRSARTGIPKGLKKETWHTLPPTSQLQTSLDELGGDSIRH